MPDYSFLLSKYPEFVTKDQFYRICHISKNTALYYIKNGFIPCIDSGKKTRRYKIAIKDIIFFLEDRDKNPEKYYLPNHYNNPFLPGSIRRYKFKSRPVKSKLVCKLPRHFKCSNQPMVASVYAAKAVDNELHGMLG